MAGRNGIAAVFTGGSLAKNYTPTVARASWWMVGQDDPVLFTWQEIEAMRWDARVQFGLRMLRAPVYTAKWKVESDGKDTSAFVDGVFRKIWDQDIDRVLQSLDFGSAGGEVLYQVKPKSIQYAGLRAFHLADLRPVQLNGEWYGVTVRGVKGTSNPAFLPPPRAWWVTSDAEYSPWYGRSRLRSVWPRWKEKTARQGAVESRRLWYMKNAFNGGVLRHPMGVLEMPDGSTRSCQDYARELLEKMEAGAVIALPNSFDPERGKYLWDYEYPKVNGDLSSVQTYLEALDREILEGMGIPQEVLQAAESGSGYAGRAVPAMMFWTSEDRVVANVISTLDRQFVRKLVEANYRMGALRSNRYRVVPESLVPKPPEEGQQGQGASGMSGMMQGIQGQAAGGRGGPQAGGAYTGPRGGHGYYDARGHVRYGKPPGAQMSLGALRLSWEAYTGPHGGRGWKRGDEIRYQEAMPGDNEHADAALTPVPPSSPQSPGALRRAADRAARETVRKHGGVLRALGAPGRWLRDRTKQLYKALENRYGRKQAILIFAAGHVVGLATPLAPIPGSTVLGMAPFVAVAEVYLQARRAVAKARERKDAPARLSLEMAAVRRELAAREAPAPSVTPEDVRAAVAAAVGTLREQVEQIKALAGAPRTKVVERDARGLIVRVVEG